SAPDDFDQAGVGAAVARCAVAVVAGFVCLEEAIAAANGGRAGRRALAVAAEVRAVVAGLLLVDDVVAAVGPEHAASGTDRAGGAAAVRRRGRVGGPEVALLERRDDSIAADGGADRLALHEVAEGEKEVRLRRVPLGAED